MQSISKQSISAFTLVELTLVTVILSVLVGVLFQTYTVISRTAFQSQITATLQKETLFFIQSLQNDIDHGKIYQPSINRSDQCTIRQGSTDIVYKKKCDNENTCGVIRIYGGNQISITDPNQLHIKEFSCLGAGGSGQTQGFWLRATIQSKKYPLINQTIQTFFSSP